MKEPRFPRDDKGHAVPVDCPKNCSGRLRYEGHGFWRCDGLVDPEDDENPLEACGFMHEDRKPYEALERKQ